MGKETGRLKKLSSLDVAQLAGRTVGKLAQRGVRPRGVVERQQRFVAAVQEDQRFAAELAVAACLVEPSLQRLGRRVAAGEQVAQAQRPSRLKSCVNALGENENRSRRAAPGLRLLISYMPANGGTPWLVVNIVGRPPAMFEPKLKPHKLSLTLARASALAKVTVNAGAEGSRAGREQGLHPQAGADPSGAGAGAGAGDAASRVVRPHQARLVGRGEARETRRRPPCRHRDRHRQTGGRAPSRCDWRWPAPAARCRPG